MVKELDDEAKETSLYDRFLPTYRDERRRQKERRIINRRNASSSCLEVRERFKTILVSLSLQLIISSQDHILIYSFLHRCGLSYGRQERISFSGSVSEPFPLPSEQSMELIQAILCEFTT